MKRIIYSTVTKVIAALLFVASITYSVLVFTNCGIEYYSFSDEAVYRFERSFEDTEIFNWLLHEPESVIYNICMNPIYNPSSNAVEDTVAEDYYDDYEVDTGIPDVLSKPIDAEAIADAIEYEFASLYTDGKIKYYVRCGERVFTNCGATDEYELMGYRFYNYVSRDEEGNIDRDTSASIRYYPYFLDRLSYYGETTPITLCVSVDETYVDEMEHDWQYQKTVVREALVNLAVPILTALLLFVYLLCVCGKDRHGEQRRMWVDNIWTEVHIAAIAGSGAGAVALGIFLVEEYTYRVFALEYFNVIFGATAALASAVILTSSLSVVRNIKCKNFLASTLIFRIVKFVFRVLAVVLKWTFKVLKWCGRKLAACARMLALTLSKRTGVILIGLLGVYTVLIGLICIFAVGWHEPAMLIFAVIVFALAVVAVAFRSRDVDEIKKGVAEVRGGNVSYKIPEPRSIDLKALASNVNDIAKGLDESVAAKVKAERLKTELITNVSHDLKTPITSIISYAQLLSEAEGLSEEARDYVQVISKKGERLKNLTQDLFDISKVQSGNEEVVLEKLDAALLINQSLAEHEREIEKSGLPFVVDTPKELYFMADGRKMSRVLDNLISNVLKYSMKNTRVFISAREVCDEIIMELKNIASYPMEFSADEIVGRFVRGDEARSAEGNGLGLAIVKSYTELCGGVLEVIVDGDMFKAILKFKRYR